MVKRLQVKLIIILTAILWLMLWVFLIIFNGYDYMSLENEYNRSVTIVEQKVKRLYRNNVSTEYVDRTIEEIKDCSDIYSVIIDSDGQILYCVYSKSRYEKIASSVHEIWEKYPERVIIRREEEQEQEKDIQQNRIKLQSQRRIQKDEKYHYKVKRLKEGICITYYENDVLYSEMKYVMVISVVIAFVGAFVLLAVSVGLTLLITRPVAESYEKQKRFVADASHELKTPLAVIGVNLEMLSKNKNQEKYISYIEQESKKMNQLIQELLLMATVDEAEYKLEFKELDLSDLVEGAVCPFEAVAYELGITLDVQIEEHISYVGNADKLQRLVGIFLDNAMKHADFEKQVHVLLKREKKHILFSVTNTGKTISKVDQKKIFERFYRADKARSRKEGRFGLGLSIAKAIVEQHHGKIQVHSEHNITSFLVKL